MIMIMIIREEPAKVSLMNFVAIVISKAIYSKWSSLAAANPADAKRSLVCLFLCAFPFLSLLFLFLAFHATRFRIELDAKLNRVEQKYIL